MQPESTQPAGSAAPAVSSPPVAPYEPPVAPVLPPPDPQSANLANQLSGDEVLEDLNDKIVKLPPGVKLTSNLDTYENEKPDEPFWFQHAGELFHMVDPDEVDFQDIIIGQENPRLMMHILIDPDHRDRFFGKRLPLGKMKKLISDYTKHFGLTDLGELGGSARSSNGTQGR